MAKRVRIAGLQMLVTEDVPQNEGRIAEGLRRAAADEADFLLTPEGSLSGYYAEFDGEEVEAAAAGLAKRAKELGVGLALGTCYKEADEESEYCYNQVRLHAKDGTYLGYHAKILRCSSLEYPGTGEMLDYVEGALRTFEWNGIRFGVLICNDLWATPRYTTIPNPYLPWKLWQMGAQFMLHAINSGRDQRHRRFHESSTELWARALQLPIVQVNATPADGGPVNAPSGALDADGVRSVDVADCGEQYFLCDLAIPECGVPRD
jgi:predicted amidohydrolase